MFEVAERLAARGITREALVEAGMALYVPHGMEADAARARLGALLERHLRDPNVAALLIGAMLLEEELVERRRQLRARLGPGLPGRGRDHRDGHRRGDRRDVRALRVHAVR